MPLTVAERKRLRARAHTLKPVVQVGEGGLSEGLLAETDRALDHHELIKVRLPAEERATRAGLARALCESVGAEQVQTIGRVVVLWRARPEQPGRRPRKR